MVKRGGCGGCRGGEGAAANGKVKEEEEEGGREPAPAAPSRQALEEEGLSFVELYTALCTKNHALLPALFLAFSKVRRLRAAAPYPPTSCLLCVAACQSKCAMAPWFEVVLHGRDTAHGELKVQVLM